MGDDGKPRRDQEHAPTLDATAPLQNLSEGIQKASTRDVGLDHTEVVGDSETQTRADGSIPEIAGYEVQGEIARGGMGCLYAATDLTLNREVAIKVLLPPVYPEAMRRFVIESKITARLPHPGIPPVYAMGEWSAGEPYLAMKLVRGHTMADLLKERTSLADDLPRWLVVFNGICQAVGFAHSQGILHRDLKPANVMVGAFGEVQVMDWGLAKDLGEADKIDATQQLVEQRPEEATSQDMPTQAGTVMGTPAYMSPEQARGEVVDTTADVFSLGAILTTILTGSPAFTGQSSIEMVRKAADGETSEACRRLDQCGADADLVSLAKKCLSADKTNRPQDAQVVAESVDAYRASVEERLKQAQAEKAAAEVRSVEQRKRRQQFVFASAAVLLTLLVGVIGTTVGLIRTNDALDKLTIEQGNTESALQNVTNEREQTEAALVKLSSSRQRNLENLRHVTDQLVSEKLERQDSINETDRILLDGLVPMWSEIASARDDSAEGGALQAEGYYRVARLREWLGERDAAESDFKEALKIQQTLIDEFPERADFQQDLARTHNSFAIMLRDRGQLEGAEEHYRAALARIEQLNADYPSEREYLQDLAGWQNNLGRLLSRSGRAEEALTCLRSSLDHRKQLATNHPNETMYRRDLAESQNNLGILLINLGQTTEAEVAFVRSLEVRKKLLDDVPDEPENRLLLANSYNNLGLFGIHTGNMDLAVENLNEALVHKQQLVRDYPGVPKYRQDLANANTNLGGVVLESDPGEAENLLLEGKLLIEDLANEYPEVPDYQRDLALSYNKLGSLYSDRQNFTSAENHLQEALSIESDLITRFPTDTHYKSDQSSTLFKLAIVNARRATLAEDGQRGFSDDAMLYLKRAVDSGWSDAQQMANHEDLSSLADREDFQALLTELGWNNDECL